MSWRCADSNRLPTSGRGLRRLHPLAVLPVEMPLLRLQQPCAPRRHRRGALRARLRGRDRRDRGARARPHRLDDLLRRRHAVADAAGDRRAPSSTRSRGIGGRARRRGHARSQSDQRRGARFRGYRSAGVNRVSLGVQALDDARSKTLGRLHTAREALDAVAIARASSSAIRSI